jgi:hypothetical protein
MSVTPAPPPEPTQKTSHGTRNIAIVVIIIVLIVGIGFEAANESSTSQSTSQSKLQSTASVDLHNSPMTVQVISSGTVVPIKAGHYTSYMFTLPPPFYATQTISYTITGSFTATNGITAYIMGPSDFSVFSSGSPSYYFYTTAKVSSGGISTILSAGKYYLVFDNTNLTESSATITQSITASGTPDENVEN